MGTYVLPLPHSVAVVVVVAVYSTCHKLLPKSDKFHGNLWQLPVNAPEAVCGTTLARLQNYFCDFVECLLRVWICTSALAVDKIWTCLETLAGMNCKDYE